MLVNVQPSVLADMESWFVAFASFHGKFLHHGHFQATSVMSLSMKWEEMLSAQHYIVFPATDNIEVNNY